MAATELKSPNLLFLFIIYTLCGCAVSQSVMESTDVVSGDISFSEVYDWTTNQWIVVGAVVLLFIIYAAMICTFCCRRCKRKDKQRTKSTMVSVYGDDLH